MQRDEAEPEPGSKLRQTEQSNVSELAKIFWRISWNALYLNIGQLFAKIISFGYVLLLARELPIADFGQFNLVLVFFVVTDIVVDFGLSRLTLRDVARDTSLLPHYLGALIPIKIAFAIIGWGAIILIVWLAGYGPKVTALTAIAGLTLLPTSIATLFDSSLHSVQKMGVSAIGAVVLSVAQASTGAVVLMAGGGVDAVLIVNVFAYVVFAFVLFIGVRRECRFPLRIDIPFATEKLKIALPFAAGTILTIVSLRTEIIVLSWFVREEEIALYSAAAKFPEAMIFFPLMFATAIAPVVSSFHVTSAERLKSVYFWAVRMLVWTVLPGSVCVAILAHQIVGLLLPDKYSPAAALLQMLFLGFPFTALYLLNAIVLFSSNYLKRSLWVVLLLSVNQFGLNIVLIRAEGLDGAIHAYLISQIITAAVTTFIVRKWFIPTGGLRHEYLKHLIPTVVMAAVILPLREDMGAWVLLPSMVAFYVVVFLLPRNGGFRRAKAEPQQDGDGTG